jgi:hypothetical protein
MTGHDWTSLGHPVPHSEREEVARILAFGLRHLPGPQENADLDTVPHAQVGAQRRCFLQRVCGDDDVSYTIPSYASRSSAVV